MVEIKYYCYAQGRGLLASMFPLPMWYTFTLPSDAR